MLSTANRIKNAKQFDEVKSKGKVFQSPNFGVAVLKTSDKDLSRFGFVISTKISKMAVHRNRVRRAFREAVRQSLSNIKGGYDMVFLIKKGVMSKTVSEIMTEVKDFLKKEEYIT